MITETYHLSSYSKASEQAEWSQGAIFCVRQLMQHTHTNSLFIRPLKCVSQHRQENCNGKSIPAAFHTAMTERDSLKIHIQRFYWPMSHRNTMGNVEESWHDPSCATPKDRERLHLPHEHNKDIQSPYTHDPRPTKHCLVSHPPQSHVLGIMWSLTWQTVHTVELELL